MEVSESGVPQPAIRAGGSRVARGWNMLGVLRKCPPFFVPGSRDEHWLHSLRDGSSIHCSPLHMRVDGCGSKLAKQGPGSKLCGNNG